VLKEWGEVQRAAEPPAEIVRWVGGSGCGVAWVNIEASAAGDDDLSGEIHGLLLAGLTVATFSNVVIPPKVGVRVVYRRTITFCRSCVELGWLAQETTRFILVQASEE
jgi:hypothetical protein